MSGELSAENRTPIGSYQSLGIIWSVLKYVIGIPMVNKALDHWVAGTSNKIDDMVWEWLEKMANVPEENRPTEIAHGLWDLQRNFNTVKCDKKLLEEMKKPVAVWTV